ncbi:hypothetical protein [Jeotgalibacillus terrae]|uniref:Uncharacterized protein n=1 Tax=Jeotgalibacillus terrae TaxID=587735 RepID=A0ABW5ZJ10_9BACL|nr:hypothetical protein [Jeotgalibacillus terrae]MBM7579968.1 hypothetical protein [Jeotgalibacillus terrae]
MNIYILSSIKNETDDADSNSDRLFAQYPDDGLQSIDLSKAVNRIC